MQKTPIYHSNRSVATLMAVAATMPFTVSSSQAGEGASYSGMSGLAQREIIRRQEAVAEANRLFIEGREAYGKAEHQQAVDKFSSALNSLPMAPTLSDRRASYTDHLAKASVALAQQFRKVGKYDDARELLDNVLSANIDPQNIEAKAELGYLEDPIRTNSALNYEHTKNIDEVRRGLYMAQANYDLGKYDAAKNDYELVLLIDPYNKVARRGMEKIAASKSDYYRAAYDHTRAELLMQVDKAWELSVPADVPNFGNEFGQANAVPDGVAYITEKLRRIVIPKIDFEDTTVEEAIDFLRLRAAELDTLELDPGKKGINFVIRRPKISTLGGGDLGGLDAAAGDASLLGGGDSGALRINELRLRNVPLSVALKYICDATNLRYKVDDFAVTLVPQTETGEDLFTRTFRVPPDFSASMSAGSEGGPAVETDPFAENSGGGAGLLKPRLPIIELLRNAGIVFSEGSSATLGTSGALLITNTPSELDKIEQLVELHEGTQPKQVKITTKFVEITQENNEELGFDWIVTPFALSNSVFGTGGTIGNGTRKTGSDFVSPINGTAIPGIPAGAGEVSNIVTGGLRSGDAAVNRNSINAILNNPSRTAQQANVAPGIMGLTGLFSDGQVQVIMRGLSQKKGVDLMAQPSVTTRSGQAASIQLVDEFIYPTEYEPPELPNSGGGSIAIGPDGGVTATASIAPAIVIPATPTAFEKRDLGVSLEVLPVADANRRYVNVTLNPVITDFDGFVNYGSPINQTSTGLTGPITQVLTENQILMPIFSVRKANTNVVVADGSTIVIAGLIKDEITNVNDKTPILGDIPLVGRLFQSEAKSHQSTVIMFLVNVELLDPTGRPYRDR